MRRVFHFVLLFFWSREKERGGEGEGGGGERERERGRWGERGRGRERERERKREKEKKRSLFSPLFFLFFFLCFLFSLLLLLLLFLYQITRPVFAKYQSVVITSGTLSPLDLYPRILGFAPVVARALPMTLPRECMLPCVLARGADQSPISTKFDMRGDANVVANYGRLLVALAGCVPDGLVAFFVSYSYMDAAISAWHDAGILADLAARKLVFIETADVVETTLALDNYRRACDCGRGAVFLSVARDKVAEGIDFDRHYGRAVAVLGVPYQYTLSRPLRARLDHLREAFRVSESDYLAFDAVRQAAQCVGRVIRSKADYGLMVLADARYQRADKRDKLPSWISSRLRDAHLNLSTDMLVHVAAGFMRAMAQPPGEGEGAGAGLLSAEQANALDASGL